MTRYLIQPRTGRIYVRTDILAGRKDMKPYDWPDKEEKGVNLVDNMTKDQLETYAMDQFGVDLNKRKSLKNLVDEVKALESTVNFGEI